VNRAGGRSGSLRNIGRIEQWNVGSGASSPIRCVVSHRLQSADSGPSSRSHHRLLRADSGHAKTMAPEDLLRRISVGGLP